MGRIKTTVPGLLVALFAISAVSHAQSDSARPLDSGFKERALAHVRYLAGLGARVAGTEGESKAAGYVKEQMEKAGLSVTVEPFQFQSFALESALLKVENEKAEILRLGFNPYSGGDTRTGELAFVESTNDMPTIMKSELDDKIVVTTEAANFYRLALVKKPRAVVFLSHQEFDRLKAGGTRSGEVSFRGRLATTNSANIVGTLASGAGAGREVILSAHLDSWKGPGANDNASGVAVLLELARHFRSLKPPPPFSMRFVAFGAEELGMLGAKAYLARHLPELQNCELLFNIDTVGGDQAIFADTRGGVRGVPKKPESQLPKDLNDKATNDLDGRWMLLGPDQRPLLLSSNVPEWLRAAVSDAGKDLGLEITAANGMGSDHRVFMQAGIVATNIAISGAKTHSPEDVLESVNADSLEKAARIVSAVVEKAGRVAK